MLLDKKKIFIFDMDGVLYRHTEPIPGASEVINELYRRGKIVVFLTNNSTKTPTQYVEKLKTIGISADEEHIFTSATITAHFLAEEYLQDSAEEDHHENRRKVIVYVVGERGLREALEEKGFILLNDLRPDLEEHHLLPEDVQADLVVMGMDTHLTYAKMRTAMMLILKGAEFYCTNADYNFPVPGTLWPGTGAQVAFLQTALNRPPKKIFGKPSPEGILMILKKFGVSRQDAVVIGDRFNTDIWAGNNAGVDTVAVETGINTSADLDETPPEQRPKYIYRDLKAWFEDWTNEHA